MHGISNADTACSLIIGAEWVIPHVEDLTLVFISVSLFVTQLARGRVNLMRTTCQLVKMNIISFTEPIRESLQKNNLISKLVMHYLKSFIVIGCTNSDLVVVTNQKLP